MNEFPFDVETTTRNRGHPFTPSNKLVCWSSKDMFKYHTDPDFRSALQKGIEEADELVGHNIKFDLHWLCNELPSAEKLILNKRIWDTMLAEYVLSSQRFGFKSLDETLATYNIPPKKFDNVKEYWENKIDTVDIPIPILEEYSRYDSDCLPELKEWQQASMTPAQIAIVYLMGEDMKTLVHAEQAGIKFNSKEALEYMDSLSNEIKLIEAKLFTFLPDIPIQCVFNWDSGDHLSVLLYGGTLSFPYTVQETSEYKSGPNKGQSYTRNRHYTHEVVFPKLFVPLERTEVKKTVDNPEATTRLYKTDSETLKQLKTSRKTKEILELLQERAEKIKVVEMVAGIFKRFQEMEWEDDFIHGQFNQNVTITSRLSSSGPNLQNTPTEVDKLLVSRYAG